MRHVPTCRASGNAARFAKNETCAISHANSRTSASPVSTSRRPMMLPGLGAMIISGSARSSDRPARPGPFEPASQRLQEVDQIILVLLGHLPGNARHGDGSVAFQLFIQEALDEVFVVRNRVLGRVREILESN